MTGTRAHTQEGHTTTDGPQRPNPSRLRATPGGARQPRRAAASRTRRRTTRTGSRPPATGTRTKGKEDTPICGERGIPTWGAAENTVQRTTTP